MTQPEYEFAKGCRSLHNLPVPSTASKTHQRARPFLACTPHPPPSRIFLPPLIANHSRVNRPFFAAGRHAVVELGGRFAAMFGCPASAWEHAAALACASAIAAGAAYIGHSLALQHPQNAFVLLVKITFKTGTERKRIPLGSRNGACGKS